MLLSPAYLIIHNKELVHQIVLSLCLIKSRSAAGTRLQNNGDADEKEDVASEHEDKTHSSRHHHRSDSHNRALSLPWLQVLKFKTLLRSFPLGT